MLLISSAGATASLLHRNAEVEPHLPLIYSSSLNDVSVINHLSPKRISLSIAKKGFDICGDGKKQKRRSVKSDYTERQVEPRSKRAPS
jgi:hypothetical protein